MQIQIDSREHKKERERIERQFDHLGVRYFTSKLYVGDYMSLDCPRVVIDRKKNLLELCSNVTWQHERFKAELLRAEEQGIKIIILCEHGGDIECLEDVYFWQNPRLDEHEKAIKGDKLFHCLNTIRYRYGVDFVFCTKSQTGQKIVELLGDGNGTRHREDKTEH